MGERGWGAQSEKRTLARAHTRTRTHARWLYTHTRNRRRAHAQDTVAAEAARWLPPPARPFLIEGDPRQQKGRRPGPTLSPGYFLSLSLSPLPLLSAPPSLRNLPAATAAQARRRRRRDPSQSVQCEIPARSESIRGWWGGVILCISGRRRCTVTDLCLGQIRVRSGSDPSQIQVRSESDPSQIRVRSGLDPSQMPFGAGRRWSRWTGLKARPTRRRRCCWTCGTCTRARRAVFGEGSRQSW